MKRKVIVTVAAVLAALLIMPAMYILAGWGIVFVGALLYGHFGEKLTEPEVTYGEFPFELVYSVDGDERTVNDVFICEFEESFYNFDLGPCRQWSGYVKSTGEESVLLHTDGGNEVYCVVGRAEYYMGEEKYSAAPVPQIFIKMSEGKGTTTVYDPELVEEILGDCEVEILSYSFAEPIENLFE